MDLRRISEPLKREDKVAVVTLALAKAQERVLHNDEDDLIRRYIETAFDFLHGPLGWLNGYCLLEEEFELRFGGFDNTLELPLRPVEDEDAVVLARRLALGSYTYVPAGSVMVTRFDEIGSAALARLTTTGLQAQAGVVDPQQYRIRFKAGWGDPRDVPSPLKQAMLMLVGHLYQNREATVSEPNGSATDLTGATISALVHWDEEPRDLTCEVVSPASKGQIKITGPATITSGLPEGNSITLVLTVIDSQGNQSNDTWPVYGERL